VQSFERGEGNDEGIKTGAHNNRGYRNKGLIAKITPHLCHCYIVTSAYHVEDDAAPA
jgi:hypothetical protein